MILKITNDFNLILNKDDYRAFVASIDLLSLHCPVCGVVGLFILYGHYKRFVIIDDISSGDCKIQIPVQRYPMYSNVNPLMPCFQLNFVPYTQLLIFSFTILSHLMRMTI